MAIKRQLILEQWNHFRQIYPPEVSRVQIEECRKAFYAGAASLMDAIQACLSEGPGETQGDLDQMAAIQREFEDYARELVRNLPRDREALNATRRS